MISDLNDNSLRLLGVKLWKLVAWLLFPLYVLASLALPGLIGRAIHPPRQYEITIIRPDGIVDDVLEFTARSCRPVFRKGGRVGITDEWGFPNGRLIADVPQGWKYQIESIDDETKLDYDL